MYKPRAYMRYQITGTVIIKDETDPAYSEEGALSEICFAGFTMITKSEIEIGRIVSFEIRSLIVRDDLYGKVKIKDIKEISQDNGVFYRVGVEFVEFNKKVVIALINMLHRDMPKNSQGKKPGSSENKDIPF